MLLVHAFMLLLIVLLIPAVAHAWGPGVHVELALQAIDHAALAAPVIAELILAFPKAFIYGTTSPDITIGKKYAGYHHHCHNWRIGRLILNESKTERERAAACGYLMHLAADAVAHNYYIPVKIVRSHSTRLLSHTYWEMRFDLGVSDKAWEQLREIRSDEVEEFDKLLERVLRKTLFSFSTNKRIFNTILMLQKMKGLRTSLKYYAARSRFGLTEEKRKHYLDLTFESAMGVLRDPQRAPCTEVDPVGVRKIAYARALRQHIRDAIHRGLLSPERATVFVDVVREQLAIGLYRPEMKLPLITDVL